MYSNEPYGRAAALRFAQSDTGINVAVGSSFDNANDIETALSKLKNVYAIVVFVNLDVNLQLILKAAKQLGMLNGDNIFIFSETLMGTLSMYDFNTRYEAKEVISNAADLLPYVFLVTIETGKFARTTYIVENMNDTVSGYTRFAFDAALAIGHAVKNVYANKGSPSNGTLLAETMKKVSFVGCSGRHSFNTNQDRMGSIYGMYQVLPGKLLELMAKYEAETGLVVHKNSFPLQGNKGVKSKLITPVSSIQMNIWTPVLIAYSPRAAASYQLHDLTEQLLMYGGTDYTTVFDDLWAYSLSMGF